MKVIREWVHDPDAELDYVEDWSAWLETGDTIDSSSVVVVEGDVVVEAQTNDDTSITAWISGGTVGTDAYVTFRAVTAGGRTDDRTIKLQVRER